jgi:hypothetical protein
VNAATATIGRPTPMSKTDLHDQEIFEEPAGVDSFHLAIACYLIAMREYPDELITLQQGIRVTGKVGKMTSERRPMFPEV